MGLITLYDSVIQDLYTLIKQIGNDHLETRRKLQTEISELKAEIIVLKKQRNLQGEY